MEKNDACSHREQGVPLEGPFLGHFSQGILGEMNEKTYFSDFNIFCDFNPTTSSHKMVLETKPFNVRSNPKLDVSKTLDGLECPEGYQATFYS